MYWRSKCVQSAEDVLLKSFKVCVVARRRDTQVKR